MTHGQSSLHRKKTREEDFEKNTQYSNASFSSPSKKEKEKNWKMKWVFRS